MCGLFGAISDDLSNGEIGAVQDLGIVSTLRGFQGSGVITIGHDNKTYPLRHIGPASQLMFHKQFAELTFQAPKEKRKKAIIGHARWPTKGDHSIQNVHPHRSKHIIGVHNGTMEMIDGKPIPKDASDSVLLFKSIAEKGIDEAVKGWRGAYALVWVDEKEKLIYFLRNSQRTLHFAETCNGRTVYWASERVFLECAVERKLSQGQQIKYTYLNPDILMAWDLTDLSGKPVIEKALPYVPYYEPYKPANHYKKDWDEWGYYDKVTKRFVKPLPKNNIVPLIPRRKKREDYDWGCCAWCSDTPSEKEMENAVPFDNDKNFVCEACAKDEFVQECLSLAKKPLAQTMLDEMLDNDLNDELPHLH
jgi:asparagine synthetase B (glutamine-hydrolysing)